MKQLTKELENENLFKDIDALPKSRPSEQEELDSLGKNNEQLQRMVQQL